MLKIRQLAFILEHGTLYELIPKDHFLKKIAAVVDFSLANEKFAESYCRVLWSAGEGARVMAEVQVKRLIADATHIEADTRMQRPLAVFRAMAKKITRAMRKHHPNQASAVSDLPETKDLNAQQAGEVLAAHLETVIDQVKHIVPTVKGPPGVTYFFDPQVCAEYPLRDGFYNGQKIGKSVTVSESNPAQEAAKQREHSDQGKAIYRRRGVIEHKNAELKRFCG